MKVGDYFVITRGPQIYKNGAYCFSSKYDGSIFKLLSECGNMWAIEEVHRGHFGTCKKISLNKTTILTEVVNQDYVDIFVKPKTEISTYQINHYISDRPLTPCSG